MARLALLNNIEHQDLRVITRHAGAFGDDINQVLVFPTEFEEIQREYPIFFSKDSRGEWIAVALLGLDRNENLFLDDSGWRARYVPAVQQRGPFSIGLQEQQAGTRAEPVIHIDLEHPRVSRTEGEPLFLKHGGNAPYLERVSRVLRVIHQGIEVSKPMFAAFAEHGLIEPVAVEVKLSDTEQYNLTNFSTIGAANLNALDGAALERLNKAGFLRAAFAVVSSISNVSRLIELKNRRRAGA
ncbi:MAG TPA: SapC family protein [Caulobacterales bacterium]|nr:SapC family protein [Caulobacterales bacterium]